MKSWEFSCSLPVMKGFYDSPSSKSLPWLPIVKLLGIIKNQLKPTKMGPLLFIHGIKKHLIIYKWPFEWETIIPILWSSGPLLRNWFSVGPPSLQPSQTHAPLPTRDDHLCRRDQRLRPGESQVKATKSPRSGWFPWGSCMHYLSRKSFKFIKLVVEPTHYKKMGQIGSFAQIGVNIKK